VSRGQIVGELSGDELTEDRIIAGIVRAQAIGLGDPDSPIAAERSASAPAATRPPPQRRDPLTARPWFPLVALATLSLLVGIYAWQRSAAFLTEFNLNSLLLLTVPLALASMGQTHVLLLGQFDISVGAVMGLTVVCGSFVLSSDSLPRLLLGVAALVAIAGAVGVLNVSLTRGLTIPSVVATIATLSVVRGITLILRPTPSGLISFSLSDALTAGWGFVPYSFVGVVVLAVGLDLRLYRSRAGVRTRALGFDESASARLGVPRGVQYIRAFILASVFACAGGIFLAALVGVGDPRLGTSFTLPTLAAAVLGGAALTGGRGSFLGAVNGALFLTLVINVLPFLGWSAAWGDVARGVVTVAALAAFRGSDLLELIRSRRFKRSPTPD
jgi:ribose transport system ATP-binding protein